MTLTVDVFSDVVCPWCFIGKRKLGQALEIWRERHAAAAPPEVRWHAFQLNPDLPASGMARSEYLERKFGSSDGGRRYDAVRAAGAAAGIHFAFDRIVRQPNTAQAHVLIATADPGCQDAMVESLFRAYFLEGGDLSNPETLLSVAERAGMAREAAQQRLSRPEARGAVAAADRLARELGIRGVPFFIFNGCIAVSGAQDATVLVDAMRQAAAHEETATPDAREPEESAASRPRAEAAGPHEGR